MNSLAQGSEFNYAAPGVPPAEESRGSWGPASITQESYEDWLAYLSGVQLSFHGLRLEVEYPGHPAQPLLWVRLETQERGDRSDFTLVCPTPLPPFRYLSAEEPPRILRRLCLQVLEHELDESLVINGVRVFDPHEGEQR